MIAIRGSGSRIAQELIGMLARSTSRNDPDAIRVYHLTRNERIQPERFKRFLFCSGVLYPRRRLDQTPAEITQSLLVNFEHVRDDCDRIFARNMTARVCVIGSESAYEGSFDGTYADAKMLLHRYVERKARTLSPDQQIVCVSPAIIEDCAMTMQREDRAALDARRDAHPKRRFLKAREVAAMVHHLLFVDEGYTSGVVIRMHGGGHS